MPQATTLGEANRAVTFNYQGSVNVGVVIEYDYDEVTVDGEFLRTLLGQFRGRRIAGGFTEDNPTPNGLGEWVRDNSSQNTQNLTPRHASRIAAILVSEACATSEIVNGAVFLNFVA